LGNKNPTQAGRWPARADVSLISQRRSDPSGEMVWNAK
jgi:hypothetical protein